LQEDKCRKEELPFLLTVGHSLHKYIPLIPNSIDIEELEQLAVLSDIHGIFKLFCSTTILLTSGLAMANQEQITQ